MCGKKIAAQNCAPFSALFSCIWNDWLFCTAAASNCIWHCIWIHWLSIGFSACCIELHPASVLHICSFAHLGSAKCIGFSSASSLRKVAHRTASGSAAHRANLRRTRKKDDDLGNVDYVTDHYTSRKKAETLTMLEASGTLTMLVAPGIMTITKSPSSRRLGRRNSVGRNPAITGIVAVILGGQETPEN